MFKKILIANRGEIAARIMRTCNALDIHTVGVFSEADKEAPHVQLADEAYCVGGSRVNESYLNIDKIIEVAKETKVEAIHPGYGLLSENPKFARRCEDEGIIFIGPSADVIAQMGSKIESRKVMKEIGVPVVPGIAHPLKDENEAAEIANSIGYPVMIKASSGGGGIGMKAVYNQEELLKYYAGNQKRATDFFGDGTMYIEKYIEEPHHIEIQILADKYGNSVYLWDRECSIQRRHQKVLEEAPSPFIDEKTRQKMGELSILAAQSIGYSNAGTIEFLVDADQNFYFLEMNTRLQVEHPVTEEITGIDLVEQQLLIASGERLTIKQADIKREGHAIEVRIYAEDPETFFPSPGRITKLYTPTGKGIRHELAISDSSVVSPFYDPMVAKLIIKGETRMKAINHLQEVLDAYELQGIKTNIPFLKKIVSHQAFREGDTTTSFIEKNIIKK
ncbi:biotin carboxylase [Sporosarcina sp. P13]|uniref:acetyl-CoA carboxylase biotin carboxylase subunit n=1 Tax=Sporosarcina sp. P13 TaxID=2048263 RepID=UPI000C169DB4|nr:acetyl-CoA carboxylase biotin carboxylase subunit [Sporosarcina sp. P13]PIC62689.1 biotin carboxylase [Sporosarcina sp. P13]